MMMDMIHVYYDDDDDDDDHDDDDDDDHDHDDEEEEECIPVLWMSFLPSSRLQQAMTVEHQPLEPDVSPTRHGLDVPLPCQFSGGY